MTQILKNRYGHKIGTIEDVGTKQVIKDEYGHKLGEYDGRYTKDEYGHRIGEGNLLASLLNKSL